MTSNSPTREKFVEHTVLMSIDKVEEHLVRHTVLY